MRPTTMAVRNLLASGDPFVYADCFTFIFVDGTKLYFTAAQQNIDVVPIDGSIIAVRFLAHSVQVSGARLKMQVGVSVDEQDLTIDCPEGEVINGVAWPLAARWGFFDGCILRRDRFFASEWGGGPGGTTDWLGGAPMFLGRIGTLDSIGRQTITGKVKSYLVLADIQMPKELQQPQCNNTLYDSRCGLDPASFSTAGTVGAGSNSAIINWAGAVADFTQGYVSFASGSNAGTVRTIRQATGSQLILAYPTEFEPGLGDAFVATQGCDKSLARCTALGNFNTFAALNHRGFPRIPPPETAF